MQIAAMLLLISDVHALGLEAAQGLALTNTYYWDLNDRTRAFNDRVKAKTPTNWPGMLHAGCYAGSLHYFKAVHDMGLAAARADGVAAITRMKAMPTDDDCFGPGTIRADGRKLHPSYLWEVRRPLTAVGLGTTTASSTPPPPTRHSAPRPTAPARSTRYEPWEKRVKESLPARVNRVPRLQQPVGPARCPDSKAVGLSCSGRAAPVPRARQTALRLWAHLW